VRIVATDEHPENAPAGVTAYAADQLKVAVANADFVVICARADRENEKMINASILGSMKRGAILINIARGMLINEAALIEAVTNGQILAAGLDVLTIEPAEAKNPLLRLSQVLITPHIAGITDLMLSRTVDYMGHVIKDFSVGKRPESILNLPRNPRRPLQG
jgi:phosphoglycerate dehydrogenase-like enzyme